MKSFEESPLWPKAKLICAELTKNGFEAVVAGGAVRDALMGIQPRDFDIATSADPSDIEKIFKNTIGVGRQFGTCVVTLEGSNFEVTRFRKDGEYSDGRRPDSVEFSGQEEDAKRRDFTVNALFYDPVNDQIIDYVGGIEDIKNKRLRFVGDALARIREDKLRILRGIRFVGQLGFEMDQSAFDAIKSYSYALPQVSQERITEEFKKIISSKYALKAMSDFESAGLFPVVFPELFQVWDLSVTGGYETEFRDPYTMSKLMIHEAQKFSSPIFNLASFFAPFSFWIKQVDQMKNWHSYFISIKLSKNEATKIENFMRHINSLTEPLDLSLVKRIFSERGGELTRLSVQCQEKVFPIHPLNIKMANHYAVGLPEGTIDLPKPLVTGKDLMALGFLKGKIVGELLEEAFDLQLNSTLESRDSALTWLSNRIDEIKAEEVLDEPDEASDN